MRTGWRTWLVLVLVALVAPSAGVATVGISALQSGAIWPMAGRNQYHTGQSPFAQTGSRSATGATVAWSIKLSTGFNPASSVFASPVIGNDGIIYIGCNDGYMYAVDPVSRKLMWSYNVGSPIYSTAALGQQGTLFFAANNNRIYSLNALDGTLAWSYPTTYAGPYDFRGSPVLDSAGNVFFGAPDGSIWKFSPVGSLMWTFSSNPFSQKIQGNLAYYRQNNVDHLLWLAGNSAGAVAPRLIVTDTTTTTAPTIYQNNQQLGTAKAALSSPVVDVSRGHAYIATDDTNTLFDIIFDLNDQSSSSPVSCCGTGTSIAGCGTYKDNDHVCNVMGNAVTTPALGEYTPQGSTQLRQLFWGTIGNGLATSDNSDYQPFFYSYDIGRNRMGSQWRIGGPVQGSAVVDSNGVVYVPLTTGKVVAMSYSYTIVGLLQTVTVTQRWALTLPGAPALFSSLAIGADGYIVAGANDGTLYVIASTFSGSKLASPSCAAGQGISNSLPPTFHADITAFDGSASFCASCSAGHYAGGATNVCSPCTTGSYSTLTGQAACTPCGVGTYASVYGSTVCLSCPVGTKGDTQGLSVCSACATGKYADVERLSACKDCGVGTSSLVGSSVCSACAAGKYADTAGLAACKTCSKGFISPDTGATACLACPFGSTSSDDFSTCIACPAGRFADKAGSDCGKCTLGAISSTDRQSCLACEWPRFTSAKGQPTCDSFIIVPWSYEFDKSSITVLGIILGSLSFFYLGMLVCSESTSDDEIQFTGNIVTRAGVAFWVFPINAALLIAVLYALTKNHASAGTMGAMLACLLLPAVAYFQFLRDYHVIPYGSQDSAEGLGTAARVGVYMLRAAKFVFVVLPWGLFGLGCYVSRALGVKRVWHLWYRAFTGNKYLGTYDKFNSRFLNHCDRHVLQLHLLPQLVVVIISEVQSSFTLLGVLAILVLLINTALVAQRLYAYGGDMDAPLSLHFAAFDVTFLHVDPTVVDENDDAPLEQGVVRGTIIFNGEEIAECGEADVPRRGDIALGRVTKDSPSDPSLLNLGGLLTFTHSLVMGQEELPTAAILPLGRATRIYEAVPSLTPQGTQNAGMGRGAGGIFGAFAAARSTGQGIASDPRNYSGYNL